MKTEINKVWQIFPSQTIAYYSPFGNYIQLNKVSEARRNEIMADPMNPAYIDDYAVLFHEMQHWLDHHSTLWGLKNNLNIYKAFNAKCNMRESEFYRIHETMREFKRDSFIDYYTEIYNKINGSKKEPWRWTVSCGLRFNYEGKFDNDRPILFINFASFNNKPICRTPLSLRTLLEAKAIYSENSARFSRIIKLDPVGKIVESKLLEETILNRLYNHGLAEYSVAVHVVANLLKITDFVEAIKIASDVATIVLNLTAKHFALTKIPKGLERFDQRPQKMLQQNDPGFAFYCLLKNYSDNQGAKKPFEINDLLHYSNLPTLKEIKSEMVEESYKMIPSSKTSDGPFLNYMVENIGTFQRLNAECPSFPELSDLNKIGWIKNILPLIICSDTDFNILGDDEAWLRVRNHHGQGRLQPDEYYSITTFLARKLEEFDAICGV